MTAVAVKDLLVDARIEGVSASRLCDPTPGRVGFDGVDLRELSLSDLSRWMARVTQESTLFNATLEENLRYAKPDATREKSPLGSHVRHSDN